MTDAIEAWRARVDAHHAQTRATQAQEDWSGGDVTETRPSLWSADPHRTGDAVLDRLGREVTSESTVLDVGGGAGRYALPLALRCRHATVVEPVTAMVEALRAGADQAGITNFTIVQQRWEDAEAARADVVLCAHVLYGVTEVEPFIRRLMTHAHRRVLVLVYERSPLTRFSAVWERVHGEPRVDLPALPELLDVLAQMGIRPAVEPLPPAAPDAAPSREVALTLLRQVLYVQPESDEDARLHQALTEMLEQTAAGFTLAGAQPRPQALVSWAPR